MTTHELAKILLKGKDKPLGVGMHQTHCGDNWWGVVGNVHLVEWDSYCYLTEDYDQQSLTLEEYS